MSEVYSFSHLDRLDDQLAHEYGDQAPLVKAAIHWCITGDTVGDGLGEWACLEGVRSALEDVGMDGLVHRIKKALSYDLRFHHNYYLTLPWGRLSNGVALKVISILLGNHGTETVTHGDQWDYDSAVLRYSNNGDSYTTTIGYDDDGWCVCGWADWIESKEAETSDCDCGHICLACG